MFERRRQQGHGDVERDTPPDAPLGAEEPDAMMVCPTCNATYPVEVEVCPVDGSGLLQVPNAPLLTGHTLDGRYEIGGVIGSGGMGTVYRAFQPTNDREVAVKVLHPKLTHEPRAVKRFFREAQSASRLIHPNVVTVYDFGRSNEGHLYIVMELVQGWTLGDLIYYRAPLEPALVAAISIQVCRALTEAHRHQTVHRDLKPDNVQLTTVEDRVWAKVLDFGIARVVREPGEGSLQRQLSTIEIAGTPAYMSPEQILGKAPDPRSDLYALGIIMFEMLTGERPFADENSVGLCMKQINDAPPPITGFPGAEETPEELVALVEELLAKDMADRPSTAAEVAARLEAMSFVGGLGDRDDVALLLDAAPPASLSEAPTRQDAGAMMLMPTLQSVSQGAAEAAGAARLGDILGQVELKIPGGEVPEADRVCPTCAAPHPPGHRVCNLCGTRLDVTVGLRPGAPRPSAPGAPPAPRAEVPAGRASAPRRGGVADVVGHLAAADPRVLRSGPVQGWLDAREAEGWEVERQALGVVVRPRVDRGVSRDDALRHLVRALLGLEQIAAEHGLGLRVGACHTQHEGGAAEGGRGRLGRDVARRLAAVAPPGAVALPAELVEAAGVRGRPLTGVFLPSGAPLACVAVTPGAGRTSARELPTLQGRGQVRRALDQLVEEARRDGLRAAVLVGGRGSGKSAVLRAAAAARRSLVVRVSPVAHVWPGHTVSRLVRAALGIPGERDREAFEARIQGLALRDREILSLVVADQVGEEHVTPHEVATTVAEVLAHAADGGALFIGLDDVEHVDEASAEILAGVWKLASARPWTLVLTTGDGADRVPLLGDLRPPRLELRPLGIRAAGALLESVGVPRERRARLGAAARGNPLGLSLLAQLPEDAALPQPGQVISTLLPETLRHLGGGEAEQAWLTAVFGDDEGGQRRVQAARMYLKRGLPPEMARWLMRRVRLVGGLDAPLAAAWHEANRAQLLRLAERCERLGVWRLAERAYGRLVEVTGIGGAAREQIRRARMRLLSGDRAGALELVDGLQAVGAGAKHPGELVAFAAALLDVGEDARAADVLRQAREGLGPAPPTGGGGGAGGPRVLDGELAALLARTEARAGRLEQAEAYLAQAREVVQALRHVDARGARGVEALAQQVRAEVAVAAGDAEGARTNLRQARDAFRDLGRPVEAIRCLVRLGQVELDAGSVTRAADTFRAARTLGQAAGLRAEDLRARVGLGEALVACGEAEEGTRLLRTALREAASSGGDVAAAALGMARAMLARGLAADAVRYGSRALKAATGPGQLARACLALAEAARGSHRAVRHLEEAVGYAREAGDGLLLADAERRLAVARRKHSRSLAASA